MATEALQYRPDYAVPPGWILEERLEAQGISHAEFARRCGRSAKLISEIISGKAPVEPETALQFEKVLGVDAGIWLGIETQFQLHQARQAEAQEAAKAVSWAKRFPIKELDRRGLIGKPLSDYDVVSNLLMFFGVASIEAWRTRYHRMRVAYRHSPSFESDQSALATWLRLGELEAERQECEHYNGAQFKRALGEIRGLTQTPFTHAIQMAQRLCNDAGVALARIKPFPKTALSGAAWWLTPRKAVIELSARHKSDDQLWFSLFHEAAHILLHSKKDIFIDWSKPDEKMADRENEANQWAAGFLISRSDWIRFAATSPRTMVAVRRFADEQGIAPGIVVGRLQHEGRLPWQTQLNKLKIRLEWPPRP